MKLNRWFSWFLMIHTFSATIAMANQRSPLVFEDGSQVIRQWYYGGDSDYWKTGTGINFNVFSHLHEMGVTPIPLPSSYDWIQDILFFDQNGRMVLNETYPPDEGIIDGSLTIGVFSNAEYGLLQLDQQFAQKMNFTSRKLNDFFIEGGALLSGRFENQEPYIITTESVLERMQRFLRSKNGQAPTRQLAVEKFSEELNVKPENIFFIPLQRHLDTLMSLGPKGTIYLHDPRLVAGVLENALKNVISPYNRELIISSQRYHQAVPQSDKALEFMTDTIQKKLESRFKIHRVAGIFQTKASHQTRFSEETNFFNAVQGISPKTGERFMITNQSPISELHQEWVNQISSVDASPVRIFFSGKYTNGAGLNCAGSGRL